MDGRLEEESALVTRSRKGDRDAYALLVERHRRPLFSLVYARVGNFDDAEAIVHDAFVEGFLGLARLRDASRPGAWFFGIAINLLRKRRRNRLRPVSLEAAPEPAARADSEPRGLVEALRQAVRELPEEVRDVLLLHYSEGLSYNRISSMLGIPWGTVQGRLARGRAKLRERLARIRSLS